MKNQFDDSMSSCEEEERASERSESSAGLRAIVLFVLSASVFIFTVVMCFHLIRKSGDVEPMVTEASKVKPLSYEVNVSPTQPVTQAEDDPYQLELKEPESVYGSPVINILLLGVEEDINDTLILCSVNMAERSLSMLSVPRDTYVAGTYEVPKAKNIYASYDQAKRVGAVKDALLGMLGFHIDYYFVIDQATLAEAVSLVNGVSFNVPDSPAYHSLQSGVQTLDGSNAFELFRFKNSWEDVETDPARVQRTFLLSLIEELLADRSRIAEICVKISQVADTDLSVEELAYMAYLLEDFNFDDAYSRALPGGEKTIEDITYYEVDPEKAVEMLNEYFNPMEKELTVFSVNFRQEQGASGEGEYSDYGHSSSTEVSDGEQTDGDGDQNDNSSDGQDPDEDSDDDSGEDNDPSQEQETTEAPDNGSDSDNGTT